MRSEDQPHILVIRHIPEYEEYNPSTEEWDEYDADVEYDLIHPDDCPVETISTDDYISWTHHTCGAGYQVEIVGLDGLDFDPADYPGFNPDYPSSQYAMDAWKGLPEGRYKVAAWHSGPDYDGEYDGGLELLGLVDTQVYPSQR